MTRHRTASLTPKGEAAVAAMRRGDGLTLADLETKHTGREVTVDGLTGVLQGVIAVGDRVQLALTVGASRMWTDWMPADTPVDVDPKEKP